MCVCEIVKDGMGLHILGAKVQQNNIDTKINVVINVHESNMPSYPPIFFKKRFNVFLECHATCGLF